MDEVIKSKITRDYVERLRSLLDDGYRCRFTHENDNFYMASLKHMANGNNIILRADFRLMTISQHTNHVLTYFQEYIPQ